MRYLILILFIYSSTLAFSQAPFTSVFSLGANSGMNISSVNFNPIVKQKTTIGIAGGIMAKYLSDPGLGIQLEANFTQKGWTENRDTLGSYSRSLNYLEIPLMSHFEIGKKKNKVIINVGPFVSFLVSQKENINIIDTIGISDHYGAKLDNTIEFGLVGSIGYLRTTNKGDFLLEARFNQSLNGIFNSNNAELFPVSQNQVIGIRLCYFMNFTKKEEDKKVTSPLKKKNKDE